MGEIKDNNARLNNQANHAQSFFKSNSLAFFAGGTKYKIDHLFKRETTRRNIPTEKTLPIEDSAEEIYISTLEDKGQTVEFEEIGHCFEWFNTDKQKDTNIKSPFNIEGEPEGELEGILLEEYKEEYHDNISYLQKIYQAYSIDTNINSTEENIIQSARLFLNAMLESPERFKNKDKDLFDLIKRKSTSDNSKINKIISDEAQNIISKNEDHPNIYKFKNQIIEVHSFLHNTLDQVRNTNGTSLYKNTSGKEGLEGSTEGTFCVLSTYTEDIEGEPSLGSLSPNDTPPSPRISNSNKEEYLSKRDLGI